MCLGISLGIFTLSFHMVSYNLYIRRYSFIGLWRHPTLVFAINNSLLPLISHMILIFFILRFQLEQKTPWIDILRYLLGYGLGNIFPFVLVIPLLWYANQRLVSKVASGIDVRIRDKQKGWGWSRYRSLSNLNEFQTQDPRVGHYLELSLSLSSGFSFRFSPLHGQSFRDKKRALRVLDDVHLNLLLGNLFIFTLLFFSGLFSETLVFQFPAGSSVVLLLTVILMITGALVYWFGRWAWLSFTVAFFLLISLHQLGFTTQPFNGIPGLSYEDSLSNYTFSALRKHHSRGRFQADIYRTEKIMEKWKKRVQGSSDSLPPIVFVCASGGGIRSAVWTTRTMQRADKETNGRFFDHTFLITGSSGGMVGSAYYRQIRLLDKLEKNLNLYSEEIIDPVEKSSLNPIAFSFLTNRVLHAPVFFHYAGKEYIQGRALAWENALSRNTKHMMDLPLKSYKIPEQEALIPMLFLTSTLGNDGRRLYVSPQGISYMGVADSFDDTGRADKVTGVDYTSFFAPQGSLEARFLSLLRLTISFPVVMPLGELPSTPTMYARDSGLSDDDGLMDALRFIYVFRKWIRNNTSEIIIILLGDKPSVYEHVREAPMNVLSNLFVQHAVRNDMRLSELRDHIQDHPITVLNLIYFGNGQKNRRASLSWHLTQEEKKDIQENIEIPHNLRTFEHLRKLLPTQDIK
ncbi:MAG: hypothetical protein OXB93_03875 [Cytophagales bacterium]|nr:hypothetical protein [Cytophagales bacterium]